jgi:hypothetical protein
MEAKTTANKTIETQRFQSHGSIQACRGSTSTFESINQPGTGADIMNKAWRFCGQLREAAQTLLLETFTAKSNAEFFSNF